MRFDVYGRYELEAVREDERWLMYRLSGGKRRVFDEFVIPAWLSSGEVATYLDDMLHELARPGDVLKRIE